jgi:peptide deformylase
LRYGGLDADGLPFERTVSDSHARVVQHEADHLDGILYPRRFREAFGMHCVTCVQTLAFITQPKPHSGRPLT